jgi:hypothetical protein
MNPRRLCGWAVLNVSWGGPLLRQLEVMEKETNPMWKKFRRLLIPGATLCLLFSRVVNAQDETPTAYSQTEVLSTDSASSSGGTTSSQKTDNWHFDISPYLWGPGAHGIVGVLGRNAGFRASPGDLLSHFDVGLMGGAEASYHRFVLNGDLIWIRVSDSKALPFPGLNAISADVRLGELVWTSKVGYRLYQRGGVTADANVGARYWHLGEKLSFNPSALGLSFNPSQNWADVIVGGRIQVPVIGDKLIVNVLGDVGGWDATSKLDYQIAGVVGYNLSSRWTLQAGWRYLFVDYRPGSNSILNTTTAGVLIGATYHLR